MVATVSASIRTNLDTWFPNICISKQNYQRPMPIDSEEPLCICLGRVVVLHWIFNLYYVLWLQSYMLGLGSLCPVTVAESCHRICLYNSDKILFLRWTMFSRYLFDYICPYDLQQRGTIPVFCEAHLLDWKTKIRHRTEWKVIFVYVDWTVLTN